MTTHQKEIIRNTLAMSIYIKTSAMQLFLSDFGAIVPEALLNQA